LYPALWQIASNHAPLLGRCILMGLTQRLLQQHSFIRHARSGAGMFVQSILYKNSKGPCGPLLTERHWSLVRYFEEDWHGVLR
ncbi:hypothetical protein ACQUJO_18700, partial [Ralstonia pseudosolanacearum]